MKIKLYVSEDCGAHYYLAYETNDLEDSRLEEKINEALEDGLRFYFEGEESTILQACPQHIAMVGSLPSSRPTIAQQADRLRQAWGAR